MNPTLPPKEWPLDALAAKMKQYCYLLDDLTPELLIQESDGGDYEALRDYLRQRGVDAYWQKVGEVNSLWFCSSCPGWLFLQSMMHSKWAMWGRYSLSTALMPACMAGRCWREAQQV